MRSRCGAKTRSGKRCRSWGMTNGRCRLHGGKALSGRDNGNYKTGRYATGLPDRLLPKYHEAQRDRELLSLREEVVLIDTYLADSIARTDASAGAALWKEARQTLKALTKGIGKKDSELTAESLDLLEELIGKGLNEATARQEVRALVQERRKVVESERKRMVEMHQMISADRAVLLFGALIDIVTEHVSDAAALAKITDGATRLLMIPEVVRTDRETA